MSLIKLKHFSILKKSIPIGMSKFLKLRVHLEGLAYSTTYLKSIVGPASKLHITILVIEREPSDVNLTCGFEYSWRNISTTSCVCHHYIGWKGSIKLLISAEKYCTNC